jgi:preprotein translocase subunit SecA
MGSFINKLFRVDARRIKKILKETEEVLKYEEEMAKLTDEELANKTVYFKNLLAEGKKLSDIKYEAYAVAREADKRVLGEFPYKVQVMGALVLDNGDVAEMRTGEGKTLTATMAVYLNALSGKGVHVITVNEYLAKRDAEWMGRVYQFLGLTVGVNARELTPTQKREAFLCDVTYTTSSEIGFDYLRDNRVANIEDKVLRELNFALVDEADSVLIDEGSVPLILSGGSKETTNFYQAADKFAKSLNNSQYVYDQKTKSAVLNEAGIKAAEKFFNLEKLYDIANASLVHHIGNALKANYVMKRDIDYMVDNGEIMLIDQNTGRKLPGRAFSEGLNQAIEAKEGVKIKQETITLAKITFQNFFRLYSKLSGMTGTAKTEEEELTNIYNMRVVVIPTNKPVQRIDDTDSMYYSLKEKYDALILDLEERHKNGQPVLIGTSSVEVSEYLSSLIRKKGIKHEVLNAKNNEREAEIVALAGQKGAVTIATNMAGRGTDIKLGEGVRELGGLAVLGSERNDSRRVDNQLRGRSGRQGDPGYSKFYVSVQDNLMKHFDDGKLENNPLLKNHLQGECINSGFLTKMLSVAQLRVEGAKFDYRKYLLRYDEVLRQQREIMYRRRDEIIACENPKDILLKFYKEASDYIVENAITEVDGDWGIDERRLEDLMKNQLRIHIDFPDGCFDGCEIDEVKEKVRDTLIDVLEQKYRMIPIDELYANQKHAVLGIFDRYWTQHIDDMDRFHKSVEYLKYEQKDPINTYTNKGFEMFEKVIENIALEVTAFTLNRRVVIINAMPAEAPKENKGDVIDV